MTPPLRRHRCIEDPHTRAGPKRMHQPMLPAAHQPGPKPPGPAVTPTRRQSAPEPQAPPGPTPEQCGRQAGNLRPPAQASPAAPHAVARKTAPKSHQYPIQAKAAAPAPNPPRKPTPREPPDAPGPQRHPTPTTKTTAGQNRDPHSH